MDIYHANSDIAYYAELKSDGRGVVVENIVSLEGKSLRFVDFIFCSIFIVWVLTCK